MATNPLILDYVDENGTKTKSVMHTEETDPTDSLIGDLADALDACTGANLLHVGIQATNDYAGGLAAGPYDAEDKLVLSLLDEDDNVVHVAVPAPIVGCFEADGKTADPAAAIIIALVEAIIAVVVTSAGKSITALIKGWRARRNRKKK